MPALAALSINDGATTPVTHTFSPVSSNGARAEWADRSASTIAGWRTLVNEVRKPATATGAHRNIFTANLPVEATVDGQVKVVGFNSFQVVFNFRKESTDQEKKDAYAYAKNLLGLAGIQSAVLAMEPHY